MKGEELKELIMEVLKEEIDENWRRWIQSMVNTIEEESNGQSMDVGEAYDILKTNFRADAPSREMFQKAAKEALEILRVDKKIH